MHRLTFLNKAADIYMQIYLRYFIYSDMLYIYRKISNDHAYTITLHK